MKEEKIWAVKDGYLVHRDGSIYKLNWNKTGTMRKIKQSKTTNGYLYFCCNGKVIKSHRFIASCFIPNPYNLPFINHKNEIKDDNRVENLEWCTAKYNVNYGTRNKRAAEANRGRVAWNKGRTSSEETRKKQSDAQINNPKKSKKVFQYTKDLVLIKEWVSLHEIERVLGFDCRNISACCLGKQKTAYDFVWKHKDSLLS